MHDAMGSIQASGSRVAKVIASIDEIAFQTNILALNAAIEAARAGASGLGFSVVAEEVRQLAKRSADAAHESADLIRDSAASTERGSAAAAAVGASVQETVQMAQDIAGRISDISSITGQQSAKIGQVYEALRQIETVSQSSAGEASRGASVVERLNAQADATKSVVCDLTLLIVGGARGTRGPKDLTDSGSYSKTV